MAQDYSGTSLETNWYKAAIKIARFVKVDWNGDGDFVDANEDITNRVLDVRLSSSLLDNLFGLPLMGRIAPATARITLDNRDNFFSPDNASSPIHAHIANGIFQFAIIVDLGYYDDATPETLRQFTGRIDNCREWEDPAGGKRAILLCTDELSIIEEYKHRTVLISDNRVDQIINTYLSVPAAPAISHSQDYAHSTVPYAGMDDESILSECQKVAASDGGWIRATKEGVAVFERMTHWLEGTDHTASNVTLDTGKSWWLQDSLSKENIYTDVIVSWTPRRVSTLRIIWESTEPIELRPGETKTIRAKFDNLVHSSITPVANVDYIAVTVGMREINSDLTITVTGYCKQADVELTNGDANQTMYVLELQLRGYPLLGRETHEVSKTHDAGILIGKKEFLYQQLFYMQTEVQAERVASFLRDFLQRPRRLLGWRGPAVPWLELGDRVHVDHKTATYSPGIDVDGYVVALNQSYAAGEMYEMQLTILPVTNLWAESTYFKMGTSKYKDVDSHALFY